MTSGIWAAVIGGIAGLVTGAVSSLIAPWVQWGIEKKREDLRHKRDLITSWRTGIAAIDDKGTDVEGMPKGYLVHKTDRYFGTPWYETLRPYLPENHRANFEKNNVAVGGGTPRSLKNLVAGEVDRIEQEWGLRGRPARGGKS